ncbi:MAG: hypothetical protein ACRYG4_04305 [Janthinobacterium lividum]
MATEPDPIQPSLADLFRALLAHLFASPSHTVDDALIAKVGALDTGLTALGATVGTMGGHVADDEDKIASVQSDIASVRQVLVDFGDPSKTADPPADPPVVVADPPADPPADPAQAPAADPVT